METKELLLEAKKIEQNIIEIRRDIHRHPELGMEVERTVNIVENTLDSLGIETKRVVGTGLIGLLKGNKSGKTVALRADMDALPITEATESEYKSQVNCKMHACGHDVHTASLLGAAMLLSKFKDKLKGNVKFLFQPAEETVGGALPMIKAGSLENPKVDAIFGLHSDPNIEVGKIGIKYGKAYAASDMFVVTIIGKGSHGAAPHDGIDAIAIGAQVVTALQNFVSRNVDPVDSAVVTIGSFTGGTQGNIIANEVKMTGIIRTLNPDTRKIAKEKVKKIILGVAESLDAKADVTFIPSYPSLINNITMTDVVKSATVALFGKDKSVVIDKPTMGVEDFAYFLQEIPGCFFQLGVKNEKKGIVYPLHSNFFDVDEDSLLIATVLHTKIAMDYLNKNQIY